MKNILVTGATRGIGRAISEKLLIEGHTIYGVYKSEHANHKVISGKYGERFMYE